MAILLANENVPAAVVEALRRDGHDCKWNTEVSPGIDDHAVLQLSVAENRVLLTFDKDFGKLAFRMGMNASGGVILLRPRLRSPEYLQHFVSVLLSEAVEWNGHFSVATEGHVRTSPLPK